jgi:hypothetical protein|tara:strand:+ start:424 stop:774 length:351 start_codon:yes stop_codon:yes gene_type:complete
MKYYINKIDVRFADTQESVVGKKHMFGSNIIVEERALTWPDTLSTTRNALNKLSAIGIENLYISSWKGPVKGRSKKTFQTKVLGLQEKNRKCNPVRVQDVIEEIAREYAEENTDNG